MVKFRTHLRMTDNYPKSAHSAKIIQTNISKVEHDLGNLFTRLMIYVVAFLCLEKNYNTKIKSHFVELISLSHFRCQEKSSGPPQSFWYKFCLLSGMTLLIMVHIMVPFATPLWEPSQTASLRLSTQYLPWDFNAKFKEHLVSVRRLRAKVKDDESLLNYKKAKYCLSMQFLGGQGKQLEYTQGIWTHTRKLAHMPETSHNHK